jgi:hypothetical protein
MSQNTSHAVMQQRHEAHDSLDDFPTPPWAGRALCEHVLGLYEHDGYDISLWEPACNRGHLFDGLRHYFGKTLATDIFDYGWHGHQETLDFLLPIAPPFIPDWIITNPPFRLAEQFIERGLSVARKGVAVIVRSSFLEGVGRFNSLYRYNPPNIIAQFSERVPMVKGRYDPKASTATSYAWLVWMHGHYGTNFQWIPPCKKQLERPSDFWVVS